MSAFTELTDTDTGVWQILTETSSYLVDLDARTARRHPGTGAGGVEGLPAPLVTQFANEGQALPLFGIASCRVGKRAILVLDANGDGTESTRLTTIVCAINRAA